MRCGTVGLALALAAGCATGRAVSNAQAAAKRGDWDSAVAYYRDALNRDPSRIDVKIALERATSTAAAEHVKRARELEADNQLPGAIAEYQSAAELDPTNTLAMAKATELDRRLREQVEAARPPSTHRAAAAAGAAELDDPNARPAPEGDACGFPRRRCATS